ncbi:hypothetical protein JI435_304360, partial [Parastagonospora nodorum SN15]
AVVHYRTWWTWTQLPSQSMSVGLRSITIETQYKTDPRSASLSVCTLSSINQVFPRAALLANQPLPLCLCLCICTFYLLLPATTHVPSPPSALSAHPTPELPDPRPLHLARFAPVATSPNSHHTHTRHHLQPHYHQLYPHHGRPSKLHTLVQGHQVRHHNRLVELQHLPHRPLPIRLRMPELQTQDLPPLRSQIID